MRNFTQDRPKSMGPSSTKRALTIEDVPKRVTPIQDLSSMRRANTNESLVSMELAALSSAPPSSSSIPPDPSDWAHKQLMEMVNRSADGNRVTGEEESSYVTPPTTRSAFAKHGKSKSTFITPPESISPLNQSQPLSPTSISPSRTLSPSSSTSSLLPIGSNATLRRERTTILENRLRLKREKDQHMARMIMEEENKKAKDKDKEKMRETEERTKAKEIREQQEQRLQSYYEQLHEKQQQQHTPPQGSSEAENNYFRTMRKRIKDIKPTLPSVGLDEKLKNLNARVKGFLSTTNPLPIQKFRDKRNSKHARNNMPIKLNIVDDFMKDLELQRISDGTALDPRLDNLSPASPIGSDSSPSDAPKKQAARAKRVSDIRVANRSASELQLLVRALDQNLQQSNDSIISAHQTCAKIRAEMEKTKNILTVDIDVSFNKVTRASVLGTQFATTVKDIRTQLDSTRTAISACSDKIKSLEVKVQKVKRAKKPADRFMRYFVWLVIGICLLYFVINSRTCQMLVVISVFILAMRSFKERSGYIHPSQHILTTFMAPTPPQPEIVEDDEPDELSSPEIQLPTTTSNTHDTLSSPTLELSNTSSSASSMRRNRSDLVLQSLFNEEEFAEVFNDSPKLRTVKEDEDSVGISPARNRSKSNLAGIGKVEGIEKSGSGVRSGNISRPSSSSSSSGIRSSATNNIRTSVTSKDSVAMNLALHNLNQMSLKIQQMQQGK